MHEGPTYRRLQKGLTISAESQDKLCFCLCAHCSFKSVQIFQIPSQLIAERVGIPRWLAILLILWGTVATSFAGLTRSHVHLYILRFLLGKPSRAAHCTNSMTAPETQVCAFPE